MAPRSVRSIASICATTAGFSSLEWMSTTRWWCMKPTPINSVVFVLLLAPFAYADDSGVQIARIAIAAQQSYVVAARTLNLSATPYNAVDAALAGRALQWQVSNSNLAAIDG